jgi:hypothetical protein
MRAHVFHETASWELGLIGTAHIRVHALACVPASDPFRAQATNVANRAKVFLSIPKEDAYNAQAIPFIHLTKQTAFSARGQVGRGMTTTANVHRRPDRDRSLGTRPMVGHLAVARLKKYPHANTTVIVASFPNGRTGQIAAPGADRANTRSTV